MSHSLLPLIVRLLGSIHPGCVGHTYNLGLRSEDPGCGWLQDYAQPEPRELGCEVGLPEMYLWLGESLPTEEKWAKAIHRA